jgi:hypothetical protein
MSNIKILELIPENLRESLINEVIELLKEREEKKKEEEISKGASKEELANVLQNIM